MEGEGGGGRPAALRTAAAGDGADADLDRAGDGGRARAEPADACIGNNLNQLARWANTHASVMEAVRVTDRLMAVERSLRALALPAGEDG
ncbi:MAG: MobC family plasmid mobilization relaxosome protein [Acidobacteria bacterium]|nr:MobC family plasmid mobilization relaxosome protein [Gemmatimonadota bacterium]MYH23533.1 MobC family plasmid mobilization relaxosome protein [Acidobacteriota bacterium]MYJ10505.1 MobC family plasmid mobilization relaxosome protein [Gemmatimonadota bacterium]MYK80800.1 MobC family plasmid mobilization relaxosome protein [Acidobacteriota bacterium]